MITYVIIDDNIYIITRAHVGEEARDGLDGRTVPRRRDHRHLKRAKFHVYCWTFNVEGFGFRVEGTGFAVCGLGLRFWVWGLGFGIRGLVFGV